jgi:hypothetical protein
MMDKMGDTLLADDFIGIAESLDRIRGIFLVEAEDNEGGEYATYLKLVSKKLKEAQDILLEIINRIT